MTNSTGGAAHVAGHMPGAATNTLANEDLLPTTAAQRQFIFSRRAAEAQRGRDRLQRLRVSASLREPSLLRAFAPSREPVFSGSR